MQNSTQSNCLDPTATGRAHPRERNDVVLTNIQILNQPSRRPERPPGSGTALLPTAVITVINRRRLVTHQVGALWKLPLDGAVPPAAPVPSKTFAATPALRRGSETVGGLPTIDSGSRYVVRTGSRSPAAAGAIFVLQAYARACND